MKNLTSGGGSFKNETLKKMENTKYSISVSLLIFVSNLKARSVFILQTFPKKIWDNTYVRCSCLTQPSQKKTSPFITLVSFSCFGVFFQSQVCYPDILLVRFTIFFVSSISFDDRTKSNSIVRLSSIKFD